ncbi:N-acetylglucosamine-6-phosphate deacetylase [Acaryochloris marina]|uniref:N-acetylglucosamine-6-phosphate deacetylase n=1 Tax=Acaryochloris marina (strain MBIC 11017) TaxID=329726 RepID=B0BYL4_ACAM1|nr:N-acetylglucosamine-6-phosphate deacetylase [Acaryochloris marina]ABW25899.1 N-acetylglucosamine-6-phosphate deacetylase [Acaryochloris marina MBIC11017]BDM80756.1 N-acetylglucosamine-6-phosphate deacetylase [Acaryochloris marina MBIC10699]
MSTLPIRLENARIIGYSKLQEVGIQDGVIQTIQPMDALSLTPAPQAIDLAGDWLSLGGIDLQINGALGQAFPDLTHTDQAKLQEICQFLWQQGVDGFLPTLVTTSIEKFQQALATLSTQRSQNGKGQAQILGAHLEGPCLNATKRGAHPQEYLQPLSIETLQAVMGPYIDRVRVITLAPELEPSGEAVAWLRSHNIIVSLGHSQATAAEAEAAFEQGASMVTHAFNAMPSLNHRQPGLLAAALMHHQVWCGFIADGQHVDPLMLKLMLQASPEKGLFLVSDALAPLGLPDGVYPWDSRQIEVVAGTARLPDGTLSGTTLSLLAGVQNLVRWNLCSVERAIALGTEAPRRALGLPGLGPEQPACCLLRWRHHPQTQTLKWQRLFPSEDA